ncbi:MAG TPA: FAD/NAD(P)-binding oxidoreductase [bacterium]|nr:FAD/NAD(P)-binding oxidoreductase [bacterium]
MADVLIVGNGVAGRKAAETLRKNGFKGSVVMVTDEMFPFYPRPRLSLGYLSGEVEKDKLFLAPDFYSRNAVSLVFEKVTAIEPENNRLILQDGSGISYRILLLATGASAATPAWEGAELEGVVTLRTLVDADNILERIKTQDTVVVAGAGILGVEAADALRKRGKDVTLLVRGGKEKVGSPTLEPDKAVMKCDELMSEGVNFCFDDEIEKLRGDGGVLSEVVTKQGMSIMTGLLIVTIGARANIKLAEGTGIETGRGIVVDEQLKAVGSGNIYAAGDAAELRDGVRDKHWHGGPYMSAMKQGEFAAGVIAETLK